MLLTKINDVKWSIALSSPKAVSTDVMFKTGVFYAIIHHFNEESLPDFKHQVNMNDLVRNDICGVLISHPRKALFGTLKAVCTKALQNQLCNATLDSWKRVLESVKSTNSIQIFATGAVSEFVTFKRMTITVVIDKKESELFLNEKSFEANRNSFIHLLLHNSVHLYTRKSLSITMERAKYKYCPFCST